MSFRQQSNGSSRRSASSSKTTQLSSQKKTLGGGQSSTPTVDAQLLCEAEDLAKALHKKTRLRPGAPATEIAQALGYTVFRDPQIAGGARGYSAESVIYLRPERYRPREEFACGHEIGELTIDDSVPNDTREIMCQRIASALLLPARAYLRSAALCGYELPALRRKWPHASYQVLGVRLAELLPGVVAAAWVDCEPHRGRSLGSAAVADLTDLERQAVQRAYMKTGRGIAASRDMVAVAWRLTGPGKRAISITIPR